MITRFAPDDALDTVLGQSLHALTQCVIRPPGAPADESNQQTAVANDIHAVLAQMLGVPNPQAQASEFSPPREGMTIAQLDWRPIQMADIAPQCQDTFAWLGTGPHECVKDMEVGFLYDMQRHAQGAHAAFQLHGRA